jgi:dolichol-phosphate mannosyltransferase
MKSAVHKDLPPNTGDFRLMSRPVVHALGQLREQHRFVRGMVTWLGFRQTAILFDRPARAAGETKYPLRKMLSFAWRAISSFSALPLRIPVALGLVMTTGPIGYATVAGCCALAGIDLPWWSWLVCLQVALSGVTLLAVGISGDYVARIYDELKDRPLYVVDALHNISPERLAALPQRVAVHPSALDLADAAKQAGGQSSLSVFKPAA